MGPPPHPRLPSTVSTTKLLPKGLLKCILVEFPSLIRVICYVKTLEIPVGFTGHWQRVKNWEWMLIELTKERRPVESTEQQRDTIYYINMSHGQNTFGKPCF